MVKPDWLSEFVDFASFGEASPRLMWWVGVSTIAGALRRKAFIDQEIFQWSPNFYILIVGEPGVVKKSTSMDIGLKLLYLVEGINRGPEIVTWQALIEHVAGCREDWWMPNGELFEMSAVTMGISEFGSFFDPTNRELVDNLTDLWDGKLGRISKITKTSGTDVMVNPWINIIAATTPKWLAQNFCDALVGGGLASRFIFLHEDMPTRDIAYPKLQMPSREILREKSQGLLDRLSNIAKYSGEYELTREATDWGIAWYTRQRQALRALGSGSLEAGFSVRKQVHLHKLAMVISASRAEFPLITLGHLQEAERQLDLLEPDAKSVFGYVGQSKVTSAAREIAEVVCRLGSIERRALYHKRFFRTMTIGEYNEAVASAVQAELICEISDVAKPLLVKRP